MTQKPDLRQLIQSFTKSKKYCFQSIFQLSCHTRTDLLCNSIYLKDLILKSLKLKHINQKKNLVSSQRLHLL